MVRVLVTGASGQLGSELVPALRAAGHEAIGLGSAVLDVTAPGPARAALKAHRPDAVVNCAAYTAVDLAESERHRAYAVNAVGAGHVARACAREDVRLVHMSTDYVFDGTARAPIPEDAPPGPINAYGASKLAGENAVLEAHPRASVVRTSWLFGRRGPNFVLTVLDLARRQPELRIVDDQRGVPTWSRHLAVALVRLLAHDAPPIVHLTSGGDATWYDLAVATVDMARLRGVTVRPITTADMTRPARRPPYSVLDNREWAALGEAPLPSWRTGLKGYLAELGELRAPLQDEAVESAD